MAKKIMKKVKIIGVGGQANPAPPYGTALGPTGIDIMSFCTQFNEKSKDQMGTKLPIVITIYEDRTFEFIIKQPPASELIKKTLGLSKASGSSKKEKVGKLTDAQLTEIAEKKMPDLNANDIDEAKSIIAGTARSMGIETELKKK
jgi:large subunit ribosomal protein L11